MAITERDKAIIEFERSWWTEPGPKEAAIRARFELSASRYYQILQELVDDPDAMAFDPLVIRRLRRNRAHRRKTRLEGRSRESWQSR